MRSFTQENGFVLGTLEVPLEIPSDSFVCVHSRESFSFIFFLSFFLRRRRLRHLFFF